MSVQLEPIARAHDVVAEDARRARLADGLVDDLLDVLELAAQVDIPKTRPDRVAGDDHSFYEQVRVLLHQLAVLERPGLGLVGVAHDVAGLGAGLGNEAPLHAGREARAAAAARARAFTPRSPRRRTSF
jgi:hypothetical protein